MQEKEYLRLIEGSSENPGSSYSDSASRQANEGPRGGQYVADRDEKTDHVHDHVHVNVDVDVVVHVLGLLQLFENLGLSLALAATTRRAIDPLLSESQE